ncbi:MAG TPA: DnaJ domain-containing protein [Roseiflexaceae bacterium]|jgi:hypothetical protein|nr:DnaJ domain-containing protein [Roseiflexaceae bacterium]
MSDFQNLDYYELLGVSRSASADEIKRAYRREIAKYHPDRFVNASPTEQNYARLRSQKINEAYASLNGQGGGSRRVIRQPTVAPEPVQPRDYQAELYEQAKEHMQAGRTLQAIAVLRQLQQINPFYRDSAALLQQAESQVPQKRPGGRRGWPVLIAGASVGALVLAFVVWNVAMRPPANQTGQTEPTGVPVAVVATSMPTSMPTAEPTAAPTTPPEPTAEPTAAPTATPEPTAEPTAAPTATSAPTQPPAVESGAPLFSDPFNGSGWVNLAGNGWSVGFVDGRYRVTAVGGAGPIWSYRAGMPLNAMIGVDTQVVQGAGGLMLRFVDDFNYLSFTINPSQSSFRFEQLSGGVTSVLAGGQSNAIAADPSGVNRIAVKTLNNHYQLFANNQLLAEGNLPPGPASNSYGLIAIGGNTASNVYFDNLVIRAAQ